MATPSLPYGLNYLAPVAEASSSRPPNTSSSTRSSSSPQRPSSSLGYLEPDPATFSSLPRMSSSSSTRAQSSRQTPPAASSSAKMWSASVPRGLRDPPSNSPSQLRLWPRSSMRAPSSSAQALLARTASMQAASSAQAVLAQSARQIPSATTQTQSSVPRNRLDIEKGFEEVELHSQPRNSRLDIEKGFEEVDLHSQPRNSEECTRNGYFAMLIFGIAFLGLVAVAIIVALSLEGHAT